jgi:uncharacterized protein (TIGR02996 family)
MSPDEAEFLKKISAQPDDHTHRVVYADWLQDKHGGNDPNRAVLIRLQCSLAWGRDVATGEEIVDDSRLQALRTRERELIAGMIRAGAVRELTPAIAAIVAGDHTRITFQRGMIHNLNLSYNTNVTNCRPIYMSEGISPSLALASPIYHSACMSEAISTSGSHALPLTSPSEYLICQTCPTGPRSPDWGAPGSQHSLPKPAVGPRLITAPTPHRASLQLCLPIINQ